MTDWILMRRANDERVKNRAVHSAYAKAHGKHRWRLVWKQTGQPVVNGDVLANTKSEAKARFKEHCGWKRVPAGAVALKVA